MSTKPARPRPVSSDSSEFERLAPLIDVALFESGEHETRAYVWQQIESGHAQLWPGRKSVAVTQVCGHSTGQKTLNIWLAAGDMAELRTMLALGEQWARSIGCDRMELTGRKGWERALPDYDLTAVTLTKELDGPEETDADRTPRG